MLVKSSASAPLAAVRDPFGILRQMTSEFDRMFEDPALPWFRAPFSRTRRTTNEATWLPEIDVFERGKFLITKIDLPGMKKDDVKVEVTAGQLVISGQRKSEAEEKTDNFYRCERDYGSFYRSVPLPDGVKLEAVKATFMDGVLEISVPLPAPPEATVRTVAIEGTPEAAKPEA